MVEKLVIVGMRAGGVELVEYIRHINKIEKRWEIIGFFDENESLKEYDGIPLLGSWDWVKNANINEYKFIISIGNPLVKKRIATELREKFNVNFCNIVHPTAIVSKNAEIGEGNIIGPFSIIQPNVKLGNHIFIGPYVCIGHDSIIKDYCTLNAGSIISGYNIIKEMCYLGTGAKTIQKIIMNESSLLGAGSVLYTNLEAYCSAKGVPAKVFFRRNLKI